ncbi:hypothetical protein B7463_g4416, partial [Scytalidium lignicola]
MQLQLPELRPAVLGWNTAVELKAACACVLDRGQDKVVEDGGSRAVDKALRHRLRVELTTVQSSAAAELVRGEEATEARNRRGERQKALGRGNEGGAPVIGQHSPWGSVVEIKVLFNWHDW